MTVNKQDLISGLRKVSAFLETIDQHCADELDYVDTAIAALQEPTDNSGLVEEMERSGAACVKSLSYRIVPCDVFDKAITALKAKPVDSELVERLKAGQDLLRLFVSSWNPRQSGKTSAGQLIVDIDEAIQALQAQQSVADNLRNKLEGMRFDLSLLAASDACFNELEAKCEAFDEAISIADSISGVTAQPIEGEDNE